MQKYLTTPRILWAAISFTIPMFVFVLWMVGRGGDLPDNDDPMLVYVFAGVAAMVTVASFVLPAHLHRQAIAAKELAIESVPIEPKPGDFRTAAATRRVFKDKAEAQRFASASFMTPFILSMAMSEAVAIFGLVAGMTGAPFFVALSFMAVGFVLCLIRFPSATNMLLPLEKHHNAKVELE